jgi:glc operon protein GlcG
MHRIILIACAGVCVGACSGVGTRIAQAQSAQAPPGASSVPAQMPFDIPYGASITMDAAKRLIAVAEAEAKKHDWKMTIAVVDGHGDLVAFERMDGAQLASITICQHKAITSARFRRETRAFYNQFETGHAYVGTLDPELTASPGGFPLVESGKLIGAIGCSGGAGEQDAVVCKAAADTVK